MKKTLLLLATVLLTGMQALMAQNRTVTGTVLDEKGQPVDGALIKVAGEDAETFTDADGKFELSASDAAKNVTIEFGETNVTKSIGDGAPLSISINTSQSLQGVVVDAYRTITKEKFTGAANRIGSEQLEKFPVTSFTKAIEGAAPGIQVTNGGGQPGSSSSFRIRGTSSIYAGSDPLIILDGGAYDGTFSSINPNDIDNVTVLKDAAATSLYGSRGAAGVIVVTTKRGKNNNGKAKVTIDAKYGLVTRFMPDYKVMKDAGQYYEVMWDALRNKYYFADSLGDIDYAGRVAAGLEPQDGDGIIASLGAGYNSYDVADDQLIDPVTGKLNPNAKLRYQDDWEKELSRVGKRQEYNLSISNADDKTNYFLSLGYLKEQGFLKYTDYERFSARVNVNTKATSWLSAGLNFAGALNRSDFQGGDGRAGGYNPFYASRTNAPIYPVYYRDSAGNKVIDPITDDYKYDWGSKNTDPESSIGTRGSLPNANVLGSLAFDKEETRSTNLVTTTYLEAEFTKNFKFRTNLTANYYNGYSTSYRNPLHGQFATQHGISSKGSTSMLSYTWNQLLTWDQSFDKHHFNVLVGHENWDYTISGLSASRSGTVTLGNTELAGMAVPTGSSSSTDYDRIESYLANLAYDYDNQYFVTASVRRDGTSRFANKWGTFWSVGGGWIFSKALFMQNIKAIDNMKLKLSYGTQGNKDIQSYYGWQALYNTGFPNGSYSGAIVSQLRNDELTWESQKQFNVGLEFGLFGSVRGEINYFNKTNADLLFFRPLPLSTGFSGRYENTLTMQTNGIEFELNADIVKPKNNGFGWNINFNLTHLKDKITKMPEGNDSIIAGNGLYTVGHSIYDFYLVRSAGVDRETGDELYYYTDTNGAEAKTAIYANAIGTGRQYVGYSIPTIQGALTNNISFKGFDLSFMISYGIGGKYYDQIYQDLMGSQLSPGTNFHQDMLDRWTVNNKDASIPKAQMSNLNIAQTSDRFLISGNYFNIRNINLGYSFNSNLVSKMKLSSLRLYVACDNVYLFSKRLGMDPQASFGGQPGYIYSPSRSINFGINVGL